MGIHNEPSDVRLLQVILQTFEVGALRQPDAARVATETVAVGIASHEYLRSYGGWIAVEQRKESVCGASGNDFENAAVLELAKLTYEVACAAVIRVSQVGEAMVIIPGEVTKGSVPVRTMKFLLCQFQQTVEISCVAILQKRIAQHCAEGRGECEGDLRTQLVMPPAPKNLEQRQIGFCDRLEKPCLLQKFFVLGMAHEREVRVQNE